MEFLTDNKYDKILFYLLGVFKIIFEKVNF